MDERLTMVIVLKFDISVADWYEVCQCVSGLFDYLTLLNVYDIKPSFRIDIPRFVLMVDR